MISNGSVNAGSGADPMHDATSPGDLNDALLEQIFAIVCFWRARHSNPTYKPNGSIPLVCKRWNRVYTCSTTLWEHLAMDWEVVLATLVNEGVSGTLIARYGYVSKWIFDRAPSIASLQYTHCEVLGMPGLEQQLCRLGQAATRLRSIDLYDVTHTADSLVGALAQCAGLREIGIYCQLSCEGPIQQLVVSAAALKQLSSLESLRGLTLHVDKVLGSVRDIGEALSCLTHFKCVGRREAMVLHPEFIHTLCSLRRLELGNCRLGQFTPRTAEVLSQVTLLGLTDILAARPRKKAGTTWWEGLKYLDCLAQLHIKDQDCAGMPASALDCTGLRGLTLVRSAADHWPSPSHLVATPNCLGDLQSLQLSELRLEQAMPSQFWHSLGQVTKLVWSDLQLLSPDAPVLRLLAAHQAMPVPAEISRLQHLQQLCLEYAQLDQVPACAQALTNLKRLSLEGNNIQTVPEGHYLLGVEHLSLAANSIQQLPDGLQACRSLRTLSLARNPELQLSVEEVGALVRACPALERVQVTECNGLLLGHLVEEQEGHQHATDFWKVQKLYPTLLVWEDERQEWE